MTIKLKHCKISQDLILIRQLSLSHKTTTVIFSMTRQDKPVAVAEDEISQYFLFMVCLIEKCAKS